MAVSVVHAASVVPETHTMNNDPLSPNPPHRLSVSQLRDNLLKQMTKAASTPKAREMALASATTAANAAKKGKASPGDKKTAEAAGPVISPKPPLSPPLNPIVPGRAERTLSIDTDHLSPTSGSTTCSRNSPGDVSSDEKPRHSHSQSTGNLTLARGPRKSPRSEDPGIPSEAYDEKVSGDSFKLNSIQAKLNSIQAEIEDVVYYPATEISNLDKAISACEYFLGAHDGIFHLKFTPELKKAVGKVTDPALLKRLQANYYYKLVEAEGHLR